MFVRPESDLPVGHCSRLQGIGARNLNMKLIITGATGRIGGGALQNALNNSAVTSVVVLSRRDIGTQHPKLQTIIKKDYLKYTVEELKELEGAEACIWFVPPSSTI